MNGIDALIAVLAAIMAVPLLTIASVEFITRVADS